MTSTRIEEIRQRAEAATKGPWGKGARDFAGVRWDNVIRSANGAPICTVLAAGYPPKEAEANAALVANCRSDIPFLLDHIEKLEERCEGYKGQVKAGGEEIERLRAEREELVKALEPFANVAKHDIGSDETDGDIFHPMLSRYKRARLITVGDLRRARALLSRTGDETP